MSRRVRQAVGSAIWFLPLGLGLTLAVALGCGAAIDLSSTTPMATWSALSGPWVVTVESRPGAERVVAQWIPPAAWSPAQAVGPPNTPQYGDFPTAWAPATRNGSPEWLLLSYERPMRVRAVDVYESLTPGALTRVSLIAEDGKEIVAWQGVDPTPATAAGGVSHLVFSDPSLPACQKIKLYMGVPSIVGWNEVDAVGAIDDEGQTHWAVAAEASSYYGQPIGTTRSPSPAPLLPPWAAAHLSLRSLAEPGVAVNPRAADARGWPMLALWTPTDDRTLASGASPNPSSALPPSAVLPWRPIWTGLLGDTLLFAAALAVLRFCLTWPMRVMSEVSRLRKGRCLRCGYDLNYDFVPGCPECGWRREQTDGGEPSVPHAKE